MQDFMLHKGIITQAIDKSELDEFLQGANNWHEHDRRLNSKAVRGNNVGGKVTTKKTPHKSEVPGLNVQGRPAAGRNEISSSSVITIYQPAVAQAITGNGDPDNFVGRNVSSSSDKLIDTSDEFFEQ